MTSNLATLRVMIGLRYRLLWAHARTGKGRIALFLALYLIGGGIFIFLLLGGFGAAVAAVQRGQAETLARAVLSGVFVNGIIASLALGIGPRAAFAERVLRRYPLNAAQRFNTRHLLGMLDPIWLFFAALTIGIAVGLAALGVCSVALAVPSALLFLMVTYLTAALLLTIVERLMQYRGGELLLTVIMLVFFAGLGLGMPLLAQVHSRAWWSVADRLLRFTPAGTASALLASPNVLLRIVSALALISWTVALWYALRFAENWAVSRRERTIEHISWDSAYDGVARIVFPSHAPLVARALRYNLRCNRIRYQLAMSVPLVLFLDLFFRVQHVREKGAATLAFMFFVGIFSTLAMAVNQFGYDAAGVRRYPLLPSPMSAVLRAQGRATLFLSSCPLLLAIATWCILRGGTLPWRGYVFVVCDAFAGLFFFAAAGLWASVLTPKRAEFDRVMGNDMSIGGNIVLFCGVFVISAMGPLAQHFRLHEIFSYWWAMLLALGATAMVYLASSHLAGRLLDARRERLVETVAGAAQN